MSYSSFAGKLFHHLAFLEGIERHYNVYLPKGWKKRKKMPLIVAFHPFKNPLSTYMKVSNLKPHADANGYIIAYPAAATGIWKNGHLSEKKPYSDVALVLKMLSEMKILYNYDEDRVYATGYSSGGFMAYRMVTEFQDIFAAAAVIGASMAVPITEETLPKPIIHFHGEDDFFVSLDGDKSLIGSRNAVDAINDWIEVNQVNPTPYRTAGKFKALKLEPLKYIRHSYKQYDPRVGAPVEFYILKDTGHNFPLTLQFQPNYKIFKFFNKFKLKK